MTVWKSGIEERLSDGYGVTRLRGYAVAGLRGDLLATS
jgi:hypothetical protein